MDKLKVVSDPMLQFPRQDGLVVQQPGLLIQKGIYCREQPISVTDHILHPVECALQCKVALRCVDRFRKDVGKAGQERDVMLS